MSEYKEGIDCGIKDCQKCCEHGDWQDELYCGYCGYERCMGDLIDAAEYILGDR